MKVEEKRSAYDGLVLPQGTRLCGGRIVIQEALGNGGFGITYKAKHKDYGEVALKEFMPRSMIYGRKNNSISIMQDKQDLFDACKKQFVRESRILKRLAHPNIVRVHDFFEENGTAYYVMELLDGEELGAYIRKQEGLLDPWEACELLMPIIDAVAYLHSYENKVLHRDISPDNILLCQTPSGIRPCLIDFGAAFSAQKDFTQTFPRVKKNGYSPLEQTYDGAYQGTWSDVYSMSATFYYALTRTKPIPASDRGLGSNDSMMPPASINSAVSKELNDVLMHGLALDSKQRIQQMTELRREIIHATGYKPAVSFSVPEPMGGDVPDDAKKVSPRSLAALALDWGIVWALPAVIFSLLLSPLAGIAIGAALSIVVNGLLAANGGTVGQRLLDCPCEISGVPRGLLYSLLRHIVPLALVDEILALKTGEHLIEGFVGGERDGGETMPYVAARLRCVEGFGQGKEIDLERSLLLGRGEDADVIFPVEMRTISKHHCSLYLDSDGWHLVDLRSHNGTMLNDQLLIPHEASGPLRHGDRISIANKSTFVFEQLETDHS